MSSRHTLQKNCGNCLYARGELTLNCYLNPPTDRINGQSVNVSNNGSVMSGYIYHYYEWVRPVVTHSDICRHHEFKLEKPVDIEL